MSMLATITINGRTATTTLAVGPRGPAGTGGDGGGSVTAADITDATAAGRAVLTAADAAAQRTALGLGTAATTAATAYATAAQGAKADTAMQPVPVVTYAEMLALTGMAAGAMCQLADLGPARSWWCYDGTLWRPMGGKFSVRSLAAAVPGASGTAEQIVDQFVLPARLLAKNGDRLEFKAAWEKSGTSESATLRVRVGALGTTADAAVIQSSALFGASRSVGTARAARRVSATSMAALGGLASTAASSPASWSNTGAGGLSSAIAVSSLDADCYVTITLQMSASAETPTLQALDVVLECA